LAFIREPQISRVGQVFAALLIEAGGAFFFALSVGWLLDRLRDKEGYSVLWLFSQEFREAGVLAFYADREDYAKRALEDAFAKHDRGEVLMAGASLRLFLEPGSHFYPWIEQMLKRQTRIPIKVRALSCSPETNHELPTRAFCEEFNQDRSFPRNSSFNYAQKIDFSFEDFEKTFFVKYGITASSDSRARLIFDLDSVRAGVKTLRGVTTNTDNEIDRREFDSAPYCTVIIFPDRAFYTPNLLSAEVPVNLPMIVFHKSSDMYEKLKRYVEFLWWVSGPEYPKAVQNA
jgi:hypothetical protein